MDVDEIVREAPGPEEVVVGLRAFSNYTLTVAALTKAGQGVPSQQVTCATTEGGEPRGY